MSTTETKTGFTIYSQSVPDEPYTELSTTETLDEALDRVHFAQAMAYVEFGEDCAKFPTYITDNATGEHTEVPW